MNWYFSCGKGLKKAYYISKRHWDMLESTGLYELGNLLLVTQPSFSNRLGQQVNKQGLIDL